MVTSTNTTSLPTASLGFPGAKGGELPALAQYRPLSQYHPQYGDYVTWSGWFSCWHGIVRFYDDQDHEVHIIFAGLPVLLFTMNDADQDRETKKINLSKIRGAKNEFAILQHDSEANTNVWYI